MKNYKYLIAVLALLYFTYSSINAQEKELVVTYNYEREQLSYGAKDTTEIIKNDFPDYPVNVYSFGTISIRETAPTVSHKSSKDLSILSTDTTYNYIKLDYTNGTLLEPVYKYGSGYSFLLKEPLNLFEWEISRDTKAMFGYSCIKATCKFRGREYVAYFTRELPFKAAPWKFHGLPGVVLEVYSKDGQFKWTSKTLEIRTYKLMNDLPYHDNKEIDLAQYIEILKDRNKRYIEIIKKNKVNTPNTQTINNITLGVINQINSIEVFNLD